MKPVKINEVEVYFLMTDDEITEFFANGPVTIEVAGKLKYVNDDDLLCMPKVNVGDVVAEDFTITETDGDIVVAKKKKK